MPRYQNISDIRLHKPKPRSYFFDANVWIFALDDFDSLKGHERAYSKLFYEILDDERSPATVIVNSLLISEIINTYMRVIALKRLRVERFNDVIPQKIDFKKNYRDLYRDHYEEQFNTIKSNLNAFLKKPHVKVIDDNFNYLFTSIGLISNCPVHFDFNDYYYYELMKSLDDHTIVVTNDSDWRVEDLEVLTSEKSLLDLRSFF